MVLPQYCHLTMPNSASEIGFKTVDANDNTRKGMARDGLVDRSSDEKPGVATANSNRSEGLPGSGRTAASGLDLAISEFAGFIVPSEVINNTGGVQILRRCSYTTPHPRRQRQIDYCRRFAVSRRTDRNASSRVGGPDLRAEYVKKTA
jgi:hypothetical protein